MVSIEGQNVFNLYKPAGCTPLETIRMFQGTHPEYKDISLTYAGRLDPLAEGVLLVLAGDAIADKEQYMLLDKTYEADVIFGCTTDTLDILGLVELNKSAAQRSVTHTDIEQALERYKGEIVLPVPMYSSIPHEGKPLFEHARRGNITQAQAPHKTMFVQDAHVERVTVLKKEFLANTVFEKVRSVRGDFRQEQIIARWNDFFEQTSVTDFVVAHIVLTVGSGTYIRSIAYALGLDLGVGAALLHLKRTRIGTFFAEGALRVTKG